MKTTSAPMANEKSKPEIKRASFRWYSLAGLALTVSGTCLALTGQIKLGEISQLRAGPAEGTGNEPSWRPARGGATIPVEEFNATGPIIPPEAAFREMRTPAPAVPAKLPDVITSGDKPAITNQVRKVLEQYTPNGVVQEIRFQNPIELPPIPAAKTEAIAAPVTPPAVNNTFAVPAPMTLPFPAANTPVLAQGAETNPNLTLPPVPAKEAPNLGTLPEPTKQTETEKIPTAPTRVPAKDAPAPDSSVSDDTILLNLARAAFRNANKAEAISRFEMFLRRNPKDNEVRREFAGVLVSFGELPKAVQEYEKVLGGIKQTDPEYIRIRVLIGDVYVIAGQYRQAAMQFTQALELRSSDLEIATRLARVYAFDSDFVRANQVYEKYLAKVRPDDADAPRALGALLIDLERPAEALAYLMVQREKDPKDLEVLSSMVRALARLGEKQQAFELIGQFPPIPNKKPEELERDMDIQVRDRLAETLFEMEEYELAGQLYTQILTAIPNYGRGLIGLSRVYLKLYQPGQARRILDGFVPSKEIQRGYLLTYAAYHEVVGEYTEAKQIYKDMLRRNEADHETRLALGKLLDYVKEWEKGKAEFAKILPPSATPTVLRKARLGFSLALFHQRKFQESAEVLRILLTENPNDPDTVAQMAEVLAKMGSFDQAEQLARGFLANNMRSESMSLTVRLALGRVLLQAGKNLEAAREYEIALARPIGRVPASYFGLARASERLGNAARAQELLACVIPAMGGASIRNQIQLADLFDAEYEDHRVVEIMMNALRQDPANLAILIRIADAQQRIGRMTGKPLDCFDTCYRILSLSPTNIRGHLAMARSFAVTQNYRKAVAQYDQLLSIDPDFLIPPRERARCLYSDHQYSAARSQYMALLNPSPENQLQADIVGLIQRDPKLRPILEPYTLASIPGNVLRRELPRIQGTMTHDPEVQLALQRVVNDFDARVAEQTAFRLEAEAKELKDFRPYLAVPAYETINAYEPTNTETLFDAGQNFGRLKMTRAALQMYGQTVNVDPTHRDSMVAIERATAEISPKYDFAYMYFNQDGRNGLANITRNRWQNSVSMPIGDENEYLQIGYARVLYSPRDDRSLAGNIPFFRFQKKLCDNRLMLFGQLNIEEYANRFQTRPTFEAGYKYDHSDVVHSRAALYLENVVENGESLRQDIHRWGVWAGVDFTPTRYWQFGGTYRFAEYSDSNRMNMFDLYNELSLTLPPKQLKVVAKYMYFGYDEGSIFPTNPPDPNNIFGTVHPYFAPRGFSYGELRMEWWHWISRDYFIHANHTYYSLQYGFGSDNQLEAYHNMKALILHEPCSWLTVGAEASVNLSKVYDFAQAMAFLQIRFK